MNSFWQLMVRGVGRNPRVFLASTAGLILGLSTLLFFLALGEGVQRHVLERLFVVDQVEVVPQRAGLGDLLGAGGLDEGTLAALGALPGVRAVYPRRHLSFPSFVVGGEALLGRDLYAELIADGIPPELLAGELGGEEDDPYAFRDWEAALACGSDAECPPSHTCREGLCEGLACAPEDEVWGAASAQVLEGLLRRVDLRGMRARAEVREASGEQPAWRIAVTRGDPTAVWRELRAAAQAGEGAGLDWDAAGCPQEPAWCAPVTRTCRMPVPVLASPALLELYNSNVQNVLAGSSGSMRSLPRLSESGLRGFQFEAILGEGFLGRSRAVEAGGDTERVRLHLVGFSPRAMTMGATLPIGYVERWNERWAPQRRQDAHDSILVVVERSADLPGVVTRIREDLGLQVDGRYEQAQRASLLLWILTGLMSLLSLLIVGLAALNIMNTYLMLVAERRREIGVLRAIGATRGQVYRLILGEALLASLAGGAIATGLALAAIHGIDAAFAASVPDFPFKPESLFALSPWHVGAAVGIGALSCVLGAWLPARRAGRMVPAEAFRSGG